MGDWLLTVPLLLMEIILTMKMSPAVKSMISLSQVVTVISWCTYPVVYLFPMFGIGGAQAVVAVQVGYCVSDIISKCGVGLFIYQITALKSANENKRGLGR